MLIEWNDSLSVGNDKIDHDHQVLIDILNGLDDAVNAEHGKEFISGILSELSDYVVYHFEREEQLMRRHHYPDSAAHVQQHCELISGLDALVYEFESSPNTVTADTLIFLKHWLIDHVKGCDMRLGGFLRRNHDCS